MVVLASDHGIGWTSMYPLAGAQTGVVGTLILLVDGNRCVHVCRCNSIADSPSRARATAPPQRHAPPCPPAASWPPPPPAPCAWPPPLPALHVAAGLCRLTMYLPGPDPLGAATAGTTGSAATECTAGDVCRQRQHQVGGSGKRAHVVGEDALVALAHEAGQLAHCLVVVPPQRLAPLVILILDQPPHLQP
jgi:hypothetical protein